MSDGLTPKQEAFCLRYIETGDASEAYRLSYDAENMKPVTINRKAKELLDNGKITARLRALREMHVERHIVTVDSITAELEEARMAALGCPNPQASAAVSASLGKAKLHGLITDKAELTGKDGGPLVIQSKEQRDAAVAAALAADS